MFLKNMDFKLSSYTSCIKINGKPILPPLITAEYRREIRKWQEQAILKEKQKKAMQADVNSAYRPRSKSVPYSTTSPTSPVLPVQSSNVSTNSPRASLFGQPDDTPPHGETHAEPTEDLLFTPRLIRSNSYTLESPSPALLDFLRNQPDFHLDSSFREEKTSPPESVRRESSASNRSSLQIVTTIQCNILPEEPVALQPEMHLEKLLDRQREEQQLLMDSFGKLKSVLMNQIESAAEKNGTNQGASSQHSPRTMNNLTPLTPDASSQTLYYTFESSETDTLPNNQLLLDFDDNYAMEDASNGNCPLIEELDSIYLSPFSKKSETSGDSPDVSRKMSSGNVSITTSNRQLFRENNVGFQSPAEQIWAANKISAGVKGYLTRRLLRTERVQILIQTIKESVLCAVQLHQECTNYENIEEADVELHRRLTQQVTAACYAFHEVFFELTIREQMSIIGLDREHLKEKFLRRKRSLQSI